MKTLTQLWSRTESSFTSQDHSAETPTSNRSELGQKEIHKTTLASSDKQRQENIPSDSTQEPPLEYDEDLFSRTYKRRRRNSKSPLKRINEENRIKRTKLCSPLSNYVKLKPTLTISAKKSKMAVKRRDGRQLYLDFGQRSFGERTCASCGMIIQTGLTGDEKAHELFCRQKLKSKSIKVSLSQLNIVSTVERNEEAHFPWQIVQIGCNSNPAFLTIRNFVNDELGYFEVENDEELRWFACISGSDNTLLGCVVVEGITHAYRAKPNSPFQQALEIQDEPCKATTGIQRLWVHQRYRRRGIGTKMLDAVRVGLVYGCHIKKTSMAFSQPTNQGAAMARHYFGKSDFFVYKTD